LVVVAIIALLIGILLPALSQARTLAKITSCQANSKQIATAATLYQSANAGYVPIMFNWHSGPTYNAPAATCFLSLALRSGEKRLRGIAGITSKNGQTFDPTKVWSIQTRDEYETRFLPEHYVCPFERGRQPWDLQRAGTGPSSLTQWQWSGLMESYQTWLWEDIVRNQKVHSEPYGWGSPKNGLPQYSVLSWNQVRKLGLPPSNTNIQNRLYRRWTDADARDVEAGSLSSATVIYCAIGEHMEMGSRRIDVGSHRKGSDGGTNAVFADTHVEWVKGTRIGWP
jgi:prepilin-type processing-associated H-X9-DG protein